MDIFVIKWGIGTKMFKVGDIVEFWLKPEKYRYGKLVRREKGICYIVSNMLKNRRRYKVKECKLNYFRGADYARSKRW